MPLNGVDHLAFTVSDLDRTTAWYCRHLGFEPLIRYTNTEIGAAVQVLRHADLSILVFRDPDNIQIELCTAINTEIRGVGSVDPATGKINTKGYMPE